ncbi:MAG: hypothetical protein KAR15_00070 [Desulfobacterales bacterium]|nr:hypothetical protein [Desulfobacterales bacterium]
MAGEKTPQAHLNFAFIIAIRPDSIDMSRHCSGTSLRLMTHHKKEIASSATLQKISVEGIKKEESPDRSSGRLHLLAHIYWMRSGLK